MTIDANALTLADYALMSNRPAVQRFAYSLIMAGNAMQDIPFLTAETLQANGVRWEGNLPTVSWVNLNEEGVTTKGEPTPFQEQAFIVRNYIDVDKFLVRDRNRITDPRSAQTDAYLKSLTYDFNNKFINNSHITGDKKAPAGLRYRIANGGMYGVRPENSIDGGGIDFTQGAMTQATANKFLELFDQMLWSVNSPDGTGVVIYSNEVFQRRLNFAARLMGTQGGFTTSRDQFDRTITQYKGATLRDIGYKADQATRIITTTEASNGTDSNSTYTSIYAVNYGTDQFFGWQFEEPNVQDLGLLNNGATYRTLIDWAVGLMNNSTRSISRIYGIKLA